MERTMKKFRIIALAALFLGLGASASAQGCWMYMGTTFEGLPYHVRQDYGPVGYTAEIVDYDAQAEGNGVLFKEYYVGHFHKYVEMTSARTGKKEGLSHNHRHEYATATLSLPYPPPSIKAGEKLNFPMMVSRATDCKWDYDKPKLKLGTVGFYVGRQQLVNWDTDEKDNIAVSFKVGKGAAPGAEMLMYFITSFGDNMQAVVFHYQWVKNLPGKGGKK